MTFDIDRVRAAYPALAEGFVHFDGAAGTLVAAPVADAVAGVLRGAVSNRTPLTATGRRAAAIVEAAREAVADLVGGQPRGVAFGPSATSLTYTVSRALSATWRDGDEIVVSRLDHDANVRPWVQAADRAGVTVRWAEFEPSTGALPTRVYEELTGPRTRLVAVTAASNANGARPDVAAIARVAHDAGALVYVDGVHASAHLPADVAALGADFYVTSAYKWSGPHIAACVAAPEVWEPLRPAKLMPSPDTVPERFELGTLSFELLAGVTAAVDHLSTLDSAATGTRRERLVTSLTSAHRHTSALFARLLAGLAAIDRVQVLPAPPGGCPTVSFRVGDTPPVRIVTALGEQGFLTFVGDYYAYEYFNALGLRESGTAIRASLYHYNTVEEVDRFLDAVRALSAG